MAGRSDSQGCLGCGCLGLIVFFFLAGLGGGGGGGAERDPFVSSTYPPPSSFSDATTASSTPTETFHIHGTLNVRSGPGKDYPVTRALSRGESVRLGPKDARGWAELRSWSGDLEGYVYRASDLVRSSPPQARRARSEGSTRGHPAGASAICRDGTYSYSRSRRGTCSWHGGVAVWL